MPQNNTMTQVRLDQKRGSFSQSLLVALAGFVAAAFLLFMNSQTSKSTDPSVVPVEVVMEGTTTTTSSKSSIITGSVNNVAYYHCDSSGNSGQTTIHLVLLHGAAFTKEDWRGSGILAKFCQIPEFSVSAMDLPVSAGHSELQNLLTTMEQEKLVSPPVVLITPSASGKTIVDWAMHGDIHQLSNFVSHWIPVASNGLSLATDSHVQSLKQVNNFSILAIYGNRDLPGKKTSERLESLAGAKLVEIQGGHPCYLDSPNDFVNTVQDFIQTS